MSLEKYKKTYNWQYSNKSNALIEKIVKNFAIGRNVTLKNLTIVNGNATFTTYSNISYEELVNQLIAERYTIQDELSIQRKYQRGANTLEFDEYYNFVEQCKTKAKQFIEEREKVVGA